MKKSNWGSILLASLRGNVEFVPEGWLIAEQIAVEFGKAVGREPYSPSRTSALLNRLISEKRIERRLFRVANANGRVRSTAHFREIKK